jgi:hypothetical protein
VMRIMLGCAGTGWAGAVLARAEPIRRKNESRHQGTRIRKRESTTGRLPDNRFHDSVRK